MQPSSPTVWSLDSHVNLWQLVIFAYNLAPASPHGLFIKDCRYFALHLSVCLSYIHFTLLSLYNAVVCLDFSIVCLSSTPVVCCFSAASFAATSAVLFPNMSSCSGIYASKNVISGF